MHASEHIQWIQVWKKNHVTDRSKKTHNILFFFFLNIVCRYYHIAHQILMIIWFHTFLFFLLVREDFAVFPRLCLLATNQNTFILIYMFWPIDLKKRWRTFVHRTISVKKERMVKKLQPQQSELPSIIRQRLCVEFIDDEGTKTVNFWHSLCIRFVFSLHFCTIRLRQFRYVKNSRMIFFFLFLLVLLCFEKPNTPNGA